MEFYFTNRETNQTYYCTQQGNSIQNISRKVFFPTKYETMSQKEIKQFQHQYVRKFLRWSVMNKDKFQNQQDYQIALYRIMDINATILGTILGGFVLRRFLNRLEAPFLELFIEDKGITLQMLKNSFVAISATYFAYDQVYQTINQQYLFDIGLKYKEFIIPNELISPNCQE